MVSKSNEVSIGPPSVTSLDYFWKCYRVRLKSYAARVWQVWTHSVSPQTLCTASKFIQYWHVLHPNSFNIDILLHQKHFLWGALSIAILIAPRITDTMASNSRRWPTLFLNSLPLVLFVPVDLAHRENPLIHPVHQDPLDRVDPSAVFIKERTD